MRFHAASVSASADGDYYQLWLGPEQADEEEADPYQVRGPYLIVQRDFETPGAGWCYIETHDEGYIGHFPLRLTELSDTRLAFEIVRKTDNHVEVSFALNGSEFEKVRRIAEVIFGLREPESDDDDRPGR
ncbi:MAG: hypothetical protein HY527_05955 [Betaproteobacteria bacterium]|nr:hypothetical protein [Betaproteobacteria bacterium]